MKINKPKSTGMKRSQNMYMKNRRAKIASAVKRQKSPMKRVAKVKTKGIQ